MKEDFGRLRPKGRRGLVLMDAVGAVMILAILLVGMAGIMTYQHKALLRLADRRAATRLAEQALLALESGSAAAEPAGVSHAALSSAAPSGYVWIDVSAAVGVSQIHLTGLVPTRAGGQP